MTDCPASLVRVGYAARVRARVLTIGVLAVGSIARVASAAEPPAAVAADTTAAEPAPGDVPEPTAPVAAEPAAPAVPDAAWDAVRGKQVTIATANGDVEGELATTDGDTLVVIADDGAVQTVPKASATAVRVRKTAAPAKPASQIAPPIVEDEKKDEKKGDEKDDEKKDKKKKREHALLGAFTAQGAAYSHWRGEGVNAGHAAYAMDFGVGVNPTPGFGMYAMGGGLLAAKIDHKTIRANYGHLAFMFAFGGKYYFSMIGAGVAFNRLKFETETQKDIGLALPMKLFGRLPLPKHLYLGIGISYELGMVRGFNRFVNGIGGQIVFGRW